MLRQLMFTRVLAVCAVTCALVVSMLVLSGSGSSDRPESLSSAPPTAAAVTVIDTFQGAPDGAGVTTPLIQADDGTFYGATESGGAANLGTIFLIIPDGSRRVLYSFTGADGAAPSGLVRATDGALYGTTRSGGDSGNGTVFRITAGGALATLHAFDGSDGAQPSGQIIQATDGKLYGTTSGGGAAGAGTIFRMTPDGSVTTLHAFGGGHDGAQPAATLVQAADGRFYGTTAAGGGDGRGSVFRLTQDGTMTVLHSFAGRDGERPTAALIEGPSGELYGTTELGGDFGHGTIFGISPDGHFSTLHAFNFVDGAMPAGALARTDDGRLYGTTASGGDFASGTVFELKEDGSVVVVHSFSGGSDGGDPRTGVVQGTDGRLYGTTRQGGGPTASGVVFVMSVLDVTVTSPNGGERLYTGTPYTLTWTATDGSQAIDHFDVEYSVDGGVTWSALSACSGVAGTSRSCVWSAPGPVTTKGKIRVTATDTGGNSVADTSNAVFRISTGTASVTVSSPNTSGANWGVGSRQQIAWKHNLGNKATFTVELSRDGGSAYDVLATVVPAATATTGVLNWQVTAPTTTQALVRVTFENTPSVTDVSNAAFRISTAFVTVSMPKASANWGYNTTQAPKWTSNLGPGDTVNVLLSADGGATYPHTLASGVAATAKQAMITTPQLSSPSTTARVRVAWSNAPSGFSAAGATPNFKVQPAFVTVTSPNGGESWGNGTMQTITWTHNLGVLENVTIELSQDGGTSYPTAIRSSTPSDGSDTVAVMSSWSTSTARIRVTWLEASSVADSSNANFTIQAAGSSSDVSIVDFSFMPSSLNVATGTTVMWTNKGGVSHTTTSTSGVWDSGLMAPGGTFSHTFNTAGEYHYECQLHLGMTGTVVVK
jgi:uncharacterized repeat protein (TIGR03803 family)